jgi:hypothetical protein
MRAQAIQQGIHALTLHDFIMMIQESVTESSDKCKQFTDGADHQTTAQSTNSTSKKNLIKKIIYPTFSQKS